MCGGGGGVPRVGVPVNVTRTKCSESWKPVFSLLNPGDACERVAITERMAVSRSFSSLG